MKNKKSTILLIEDDSFLLNMYSTKFELEGYNIMSAENGALGLDIACKEIPDIILLDLMMPEMDGFEVLKRLKSNSKTADIPVIILTNINQQEDISRGLSLGALDYFIKAHFVPSEIVDKVEKIINS